ncbi:hypothetical protein ACFLY7_01940 [Patescibacteria group bacterium]
MDDLKWFLMVLAGLGLMWFVSGGPERFLEKDPDVFIKPIEPEEEVETYGNNFFKVGILGNLIPDQEIKQGETKEDSLQDELTKVESELQEIQKELEKAQELAGTSEYKGKISLNIGNARNTNVNEEYLMITSSHSNSENISISNWKLKSNKTGKTATIKEASNLPYSYGINTQSEIFLKPSDRAYITSGRSPIGTSFRTNKCIGYFEQFQDFIPSLSQSCPHPSNEDIPTSGSGSFNDACLDYLDSFPRCKAQTENLSSDFDSACRTYIRTKINYNTCVDLHRRDNDFYKNEWRIFLGLSNSGTELWKDRREIIQLLDEDEKIVDTISY